MCTLQTHSSVLVTMFLCTLQLFIAVLYVQLCFSAFCNYLSLYSATMYLGILFLFISQLYVSELYNCIFLCSFQLCASVHTEQLCVLILRTSLSTNFENMYLCFLLPCIYVLTNYCMYYVHFCNVQLCISVLRDCPSVILQFCTVSLYVQLSTSVFAIIYHLPCNFVILCFTSLFLCSLQL
jgi:hypothetical protein